VPCQKQVARDRTHDLDLANDLLFYFAGHEGWVQIDYPPPTRAAIQGRPVVHLAWIQRDYVAGQGLDGPNPAPGALRTKSYNSDAKLVM
jgi:hypothetical protein